MIYGVVSSLREATLPIVVKSASGQQQMISTVIDTGFNGFLTLPPATISALALPWRMSDVVTLGDSSQVLSDLFSATVIWDGEYREVDIAESETEPLIGMSLIYGYRLQVDAIEGGIVKIERL